MLLPWSTSTLINDNKLAKEGSDLQNCLIAVLEGMKGTDLISYDLPSKLQQYNICSWKSLYKDNRNKKICNNLHLYNQISCVFYAEPSRTQSLDSLAHCRHYLPTQSACHTWTTMTPLFFKLFIFVDVSQRGFFCVGGVTELKGSNLHHQWALGCCNYCCHVTSEK